MATAGVKWITDPTQPDPTQSDPSMEPNRVSTLREVSCCLEIPVLTEASRDPERSNP